MTGLRAAAVVLTLLCARPSLAQAAPRPLKVEGYLQLRYTSDDAAGEYGSLRRAKAMVTWDPGPRWRIYGQWLYKDGNRASNDARLWVQELWVRRRMGSGWLSLGQMKPPFGMERFTSDAALDTIDRTQPTDKLIPNGGLPRSFARDIGLQWEGGEPSRGLAFALGIFKGDGALPEPYHGNGPLAACRAVYRWRFSRADWVQLGAAASTRRDRDIDFSSALSGTKSLGTGHFRGRDTRWGMEFGANAGRFRFRSEYLSVGLSGSGGSPDLTATGWYAQATCVLSGRWEAVAKYEALDPNTQVVDRYDLGWTTLGVNWFLHGNKEKVQADYVFKHARGGGGRDGTLLVQYQRYL
jgi:phosphate-selective porin